MSKTLQVQHHTNDEAQVNDNSVKTFDLPNTGNLHTAVLRVRCTNGATAGRGVSIHDVLDQVDVVSGNEVLYSLTPQEIEKRFETEFGKPLPMIQQEGASAVQECTYPIMFGRSMFDENYFLPLGSRKLIQLKAYYSPTISATVGFATGTTKFDLSMHLTPPEAGLSYRGTLLTKRIKNLTTVASGDDRTWLDADWPIRNIGVYCYEANTADGSDITRVQLQGKSGALILRDWDWDDFLDYNRLRFGSQITHKFRLLMVDNDTLDCRIGYIDNIGTHVMTTHHEANDELYVSHVDAITGDRITFQNVMGDLTAGLETFNTYATALDVMVNVSGRSPSFFGLIDFMQPDNDEGYLNPIEYGKTEVVVTQGGAGGSYYLSTQSVAKMQ